MRLMTKMKSVLKRGIAGVLCGVLVATLVPGMPGGEVRAAEIMPPENITVSLYEKYDGFVDAFNKGEVLDLSKKLDVDGKVEISKLTPIAYVLEFDVDGLTAETEYKVVLSDKLSMLSGQNMTLETVAVNKTTHVSDVVTYANASWEDNGKVVKITFTDVINNYSNFSGCAMYIGGLLNANSEKDVVNNKVDIDIPAYSVEVSVTVKEYDAGEPSNPNIEKAVNKTELNNTNDTVTWTVTYTGYKDGKFGGTKYETLAGPDNVPKYIVDKIPAGMEVRSVKKDGIVLSSSTDYTIDAGNNLLIYPISDAEAQTDFVLTYETGLTDTEKAKAGSQTLENWLNGAEWKFENEVGLNKESNIPGTPGDRATKPGTTEPFTDTKTVKVKDPARPTEVSKVGTIMEPADKNNPAGYNVNWIVEVDPKIDTTNFETFKILDVMGAGLVFPTDATILDAKISQVYNGTSYEEYLGSSSPSISLDDTNRTITFDLQSYVNSAECKGEKFKIEYTTAIDKGYFDGTYSDKDLENSADLDWKLTVDGKSAEKLSTDKGKVIGKDVAKSIEAKPIGKSYVADSYDWQKKEFTWNVSFGTEITGGDLSQVHLVDIPKTWSTGYVTQRFIGFNETKDAAEARIRNAVIAGIETAYPTLVDNVPEGAVVVNIDEEGKGTKESSKLDIWVYGTTSNVTATLNQAIDKKVTFELKTYNKNPIWVAGNHSGSGNDNEVTLSKYGTLKNDTGKTPISGDMPAEASAGGATNGDMFDKKATSYDPSTGTITWTLNLNKKNAKAGDLLFLDILPDGLKYVANSAKLNSNGAISLGWSNVEFNEVSNVTELTEYSGSPKETLSGLSNITEINNITGHTLGIGKTGKVLYFAIKGLDAGDNTNPPTLTYKTVIDAGSDVIKNTDGIITFKNTVDSFGVDPHTGKWDETRAARVTADAKVNNAVLSKSHDTPAGGKVKYKIVVNPNSLKLLTSGFDAIEVSDKLPGGLLLDEETVHVYNGITTPSSDSGGDFSAASNVSKGTEDTASTATKKYDLGTNTLTVTIEDQKAYIIEYDAYITTNDATLDNKVSLTGTLLQDDNANQNETSSLVFSAGARAVWRLPAALRTTYTQLVIEKVDEDVPTTFLKGAKFDVYAAPNGKPIGTGETDNNGYASIIVKNEDILGKTVLYIRETEAPTDYGLDQRWKKLTIANINPDGTGADIIITNKLGGENIPPDTITPDTPSPTPGPSGPITPAPDPKPEDPETPPAETPKPEDKPVEPIPNAPVDPENPDAIKVTFETPIGVTPPTQIKLPGMTADDPQIETDPFTIKPGTVINGYRFEGWYLDPELTIAYQFGDLLTEDITLYAKWTAVGGAKSPKTEDSPYPLACVLAIALIFLLSRWALLDKHYGEDA